MGNKSGLSIKYLALHVSILIVIATIPIHFYIGSQLENNQIKDELSLQKYAQKITGKIYIFSNSYEEEFYYPRSTQYKSALYDIKKEVVFSLFEIPPKIKSEKIWQENGYLYYFTQIKQNIFNAKYILVAKKISYLSIILNVLIMVIILVILIFIATLALVKQSIEPYKKFNQYLENFIKDAMHEMKTPLGVILLNLDALAMQHNNNTMIQRAKSALKNMIVVYEDLEFFVRNNVIKHSKTKIDFSGFCNDRIAFFQDLLNVKAINVQTDIAHNIELFFSQLELSRIVDNTLSNAIKYSKDKTSIQISLHDKVDCIVLSIKDEGCGIENSSKIFERYYRGDKISGGFGIGLSIVKNICDKNGVKIEVSSQVGTGSCFTYYFYKLFDT